MNSYDILKDEKGFPIQAEPNPEYWEIKRKEKYQLLLKKSGIPENYWDISFENYVGDRSLDSKIKCELYAKRCREEKYHNINLYLTGSNSCQKTMILCNIGMECIRQGAYVLYIQSGDLGNILMRNQGYSFEEESLDDIKKLKDADILLIDDLFDEHKHLYWKKSKELTIAPIDNFIRSFIHRDKRVVITSNFSIEGIKEKFGESLYHLLSREFLELFFYDSVREVRSSRFEKLFD